MFRIGAWSDDRRERMAAIHRRRWGAPDGHCTIYGVHVPLEHAGPIRFWAEWIAAKEGAVAACKFVESIKSDDYVRVDRLREMCHERRAGAENGDLIREIQWEARDAG